MYKEYGYIHVNGGVEGNYTFQFKYHSFTFKGLDTCSFFINVQGRNKKEIPNLQWVIFDIYKDSFGRIFTENVRAYSETGICCMEGEKLGFKNHLNEWTIKPIFDLCSFEERKYEGYYTFNSEKQTKVRINNCDAIINVSGDYIVPPKFERILNISVPTDIPFSINCTYIYEDNYILAQINGLVGVYCLKSKEFIIDPKYDKIVFEGEEFFKCSRGRTFDLYNNNFELVETELEEWTELYLSNKGYAYEDHLNYLVKKAGKFGLVNYNFKEVIPKEYEVLEHRKSSIENKEFFSVKKDEKWGLIDIENNLILDYEYEKILKIRGNNIENIQFEVVKSNKELIIDNKGDTILSLYKYEGVYSGGTDLIEFIEGLYIVKQGGNWGYINQYEEWVIPPRFLNCTHFNNGNASVSVKDPSCPSFWGKINKNGDWVERPTCRCTMGDSSGKWYL